MSAASPLHRTEKTLGFEAPERPSFSQEKIQKTSLRRPVLDSRCWGETPERVVKAGKRGKGEGESCHNGTKGGIGSLN